MRIQSQRDQYAFNKVADRQDQMEDRLLVLRNQMDHKSIRNTLASEFYTSPEEQKAFKQGWDASAKPNRDLERSEKKWDGTPATDPVMGAWYDGWELVSRAL